MRKKTYIFYLLLIYNFGYCQFSPNIHNFSITDYEAGNQNWDICRSNEGKIYVANNIGLLEYDGIGWKLFQLPNKTTIRSVMTYKDLIFTGSFEEFGYWEEDKYGDLYYRSLSDLIENKISPNEEIWQILNFKDKIYFRSFSSIYVYNFNNVRKIQPKSSAVSLNLVDNKLLVSTINNGIFSLKNYQLIPFYYNDTLFQTKIVSITKRNNKYLLMTSLKGSYFLKENTLTSTKYAINNKIKEHQLNKFTSLKNGDMLFGTIKNGIYITDSLFKVKFHINKENGLKNNTILGQFVDQEKYLWLGLDNGISKVDLNSANYISKYTSNKLGAVYDIIKYKGLLYIGTNTGLFYLNNNSELNFINGSQGQVWDLSIIQGSLFCGHNEGTFIVNKNKLKKISNFTGGWTIKKVPEYENIYIQGTYTGLVKFEMKNGEWKTKHLGKPTIPSKYLVFENSNTAWIANPYKGAYRIKFDNTFDTILSFTDYNKKGLDSEYNLRVYNLKNDIVFKTNFGWQKYEPILDSILPFKILNKKFGKNSSIISKELSNPIVLKDEKGIIKFKYLQNDSVVKKIDNNLVKSRYLYDYERISKLNDSIFALNLDNGFMLINEKFENSRNIYKPKIEGIQINDKKIDISTIYENKTINLNYRDTISFSLSSPKSTNHHFEYKIASSEDKWIKINKKHLELTNVKSGNYKLFFITKDNLNNISEIEEITLDVNPPWYKSWKGLVLYIATFISVFIIFYYLHEQKIKKEKKKITDKYKKEQQKLLREKALENEKNIVRLKNEALQSELKTKSKELANNAMALVKKNELLISLKNELTKNKDTFKDYYFHKKIINKLNRSIKNNNDWEVFEENFNQVHDDFFSKLKKRHSELTPKDLKVSAYIKMKLSNKEIAPLMNISIRGVETHRYRLKKKLNLDNEISLTDYLLSIM